MKGLAARLASAAIVLRICGADGARHSARINSLLQGHLSLSRIDAL
jgi:uncharacterized tellurite resistance protein B-like protein